MTLQATSNRAAPATPVTYTAAQRAWIAIGIGLFALVVLMLSQHVMAGSGGTALDPVWQMLVEFVEGTLGRIITLLIIVAGIAAGILTQSLGAFAVGVGAGIGLAFTPQIVQALVSATVVLPGLGV